MGISRVDYNGENLIDISNDTVTPEALVEGFTAHNSNGEPVVGEIPNLGAIDKSIDGITETSCIIPEGYHNGKGSVKLTDDIKNEVDNQSGIIAQIKRALQGKATGADPYEVVNSIINGTVTEFYTLENFSAYSKAWGNFFNDCSSLVKWAMPNNTINLGSYLFRYCSKLKYIDIGKPSACHQALFYGRSLIGLTVVIRAEVPPTLSGAFSGTGFNATTKIFVPKASLEAYKTATNWSTYADYFYAIEDYPEEANYDNY